LPTVLLKNTASKRPRLAGSNMLGSRLIVVWNAPLFCPIRVKAWLAMGIEPCPP